MQEKHNFDQKTQRGLLRGYTKYVTGRVVNDQKTQLDKQIEMAKGVLGTQKFDFNQLRKGWKEAPESQRFALLNKYKVIFKERVLPRLEDKLSGLNTEFESALESPVSTQKGSEKEHQSILQEKKYIVGDVVKHQKVAQNELSIVQG